MKLPEMPLDGLKDWSVGMTDDAVKNMLGDAGPYQVVLTFDDKDTAREWSVAMMGTWKK